MVLRKSVLISLLTLSMLSLAACDSAKERAAKHLQTALALLQKGDVARATVEFRNVFRLDPANRDARMAYAGMLETRGDPMQAYAQYTQVIEQKPDDLEALTDAARIAADTGHWTEARTRATAALALKPDDPGLLAVKVGADYADAVNSQDDAARTKAAAAAQALLARAPDNLLLRRVVIDSLIRDQNFDGAKTALDAAIAVAPRNKDLYRLRLSVLATQKDDAGVEAQIKQMIKLFPDDSGMQTTLLRWYVSRKELDKAEAYLREAAKTDTGALLTLVGFLDKYRTPAVALTELDRIISVGTLPTPVAPVGDQTAGGASAAPATLTLNTFRALRASILFDQGRRDEAIQSLQDIVAKADPSDETRRIKVTLARMEFGTGNAVGARALVEQVLAEDKGQIDALKLKASWLIDEDKADQAVGLLRTALDTNPQDVQVMTLMAEAYQRLGNHDLMGDMLAQAVKASNAAPEESIRYASFLASTGKYLPAESVLLDALRLNDANVDILAQLGQLYVAMKDWPRATSVATRLEELATPQALSAAQALRPAILAAQQKTADAVSYLQGLVKDGNAGLGAQVAIIRTYLANGEAQKALDFADKLLASNPTDPSLRFVDAVVHGATGDTAAAEATYRDLVAQDPKRLPVWLALIRQMEAGGQDDKARAVLTEALKALPTAGDLLMIKAGYQERDNDIDGAIATYEALYQKDSANLVLANNLASLLASYHGKDPATLDRAYTIARRFDGTTVPPFADTYGWIVMQRGDPKAALPYLEIAAKGLPQDPLVQFHLAEAYRMLSRPDEARVQYAKVVALVPATDTRDFVQTARKQATGTPAPDAPKGN